MKTSTFLASVLAARGAMATWGDSSKFNCPANTDNQCDDSQKSGWDFNDLKPGSEVGSYKDHDFSGFTCKSGSGKRDLTRRGAFSGNCIAGAAHSSGGPSFSCGKDQSGFSINQIHVSTEKDQDVEFHYKMEDGSTCSHTSPCKSGGNIVQNDQCGGAKTVSVQLPKTATSTCSVSLHSVGFDCSTASSSVPPKTSVPAYSTSSSESVPVYSTKSSSTPYYPTTTSESSSYSKPSIPAYSSPVYSSSSYSSPSIPLYTAPSSSPYSPVTPSSSSSYSPSIPAYSSPVYSSSSYSSPSVPLYTAPSSSPYSPSSPVSYTVPLSTGPSTTPNSPVTPSSSSSTSYSPVPSSSCPSVLPKCLNTWMFSTGCSDNGDYACYCKQPDFASKVCGCLSAYGADEEEASKAASYLLGICSEYVGDNYGLAMSCSPSKPSTPSTPGNSSYPAGPSSTPNSPVTGTTSYPETQTTVIVTNTVTTCPIGYTVTSAGSTTTLETPSVSTIYQTITSTICTKCTAPASTPESGVTPPVYSSPESPVTAPSAPVTTISISKTYTVPCTYSTGESVGLTIPSSYSPTVVATSYTVPKVYPTTGSGTSAGALAYGAPSTTPAGAVGGEAPAATPATSAGGVYGGASPSGGFGTTYVPSSTGVSPIAAFTGAANKMAAGSFGGMVIAGLALAL